MDDSLPTFLGHAGRDILYYMVGTLRLPEVIAFSFAAGIEAEVGLFAPFMIGILIAFADAVPR